MNCMRRNGQEMLGEAFFITYVATTDDEISKQWHLHGNAESP